MNPICEQYTPLIHVPIINLGQNWKRTQISKNIFLQLMRWDNMHLRCPISFFWMKVKMLDFCGYECVPMKIPLCFHQVFHGFPTCSLSSQCVIQHVPNISSFIPCPLQLEFWVAMTTLNSMYFYNMNVIGCVAIVALDTPWHIWKHICIKKMCNFVLLWCACKLPLQNVYEQMKCL